MKTVIIIRGLPGSGKSTFAKLLCQGDAIKISMDDFWTRDGQPYSFDQSKIPEAIAWTHQQFQRAMDNDIDLIIVDNTHTREFEYRWFKYEAEAMGYVIHLVEVQRDLFECFGANRHNVPFEKIVEMAERFERPATMTVEAQLKMLLIQIAKLKAPKL